MAAPTDSHDYVVVLKGDVVMEFSPSEWRSLVSKRVEVMSKGGKKYTGWVFTIDPVSKSMVLVQFPDEQQTVTEVIMGHAIDTVTLVGEPTPQCAVRLNRLFQLGGQSEDLSAEEISRRKNDLKQWLEKHHIPVALSGEEGERLSIAGALFIEAPFGLENCVSANEIILARVQALMQSKPTMPDAGTCHRDGT